MDLKILEERLTEAHVDLTEARQKLLLAGELSEASEYALKTATAELTLAGAITGSNADARAANARVALSAQYDALALAQRGERHAKATLEDCQRRVDLLMALLRIAELAAKESE